MSAMRKITALLPEDLLTTAQRNSGEGLTQTLRKALETYNHRQWSRRMLSLEGKTRLQLDLDKLREDREIDSHSRLL